MAHDPSIPRRVRARHPSRLTLCPVDDSCTRSGEFSTAYFARRDRCGAQPPLWLRTARRAAHPREASPTRSARRARSLYKRLLAVPSASRRGRERAGGRELAGSRAVAGPYPAVDYAIVTRFRAHEQWVPPPHPVATTGGAPGRRAAARVERGGAPLPGWTASSARTTGARRRSTKARRVELATRARSRRAIDSAQSHATDCSTAARHVDPLFNDPARELPLPLYRPSADDRGSEFLSAHRDGALNAITASRWQSSLRRVCAYGSRADRSRSRDGHRARGRHQPVVRAQVIPPPPAASACARALFATVALLNVGPWIRAAACDCHRDHRASTTHGPAGARARRSLGISVSAGTRGRTEGVRDHPRFSRSTRGLVHCGASRRTRHRDGSVRENRESLVGRRSSARCAVGFIGGLSV